MMTEVLDREKRTKLHLACIDGDFALVETLIASGAQLNIRDRWGNEPLKYAMIEGHAEVIRALNEAGAKLSQENSVDLICKLCRSAAEGDVTTVKSLLNSNVSVNAVDYDHRSALHLAASNGKLEMVQCLLNMGASTATEDLWGSNPKDYAVQSNHDLVHEELCRDDKKQSPALPEDWLPKYCDREIIEERRRAAPFRSVSMSNLMEAIDGRAGRVGRKMSHATWREYAEVGDLDRFSKLARYELGSGLRATHTSNICSGEGSILSHTDRLLLAGSASHSLFGDQVDVSGLAQGVQCCARQDDDRSEPSGPDGLLESPWSPPAAEQVWPTGSQDELEIKCSLGSGVMRAEDGHLALVQHIFAHGTDVNRQAMHRHYAINHGAACGATGLCAIGLAGPAGYCDKEEIPRQLLRRSNSMVSSCYTQTEGLTHYSTPSDSQDRHISTLLHSRAAPSSWEN
jgi:hypothetical protein